LNLIRAGAYNDLKHIFFFAYRRRSGVLKERTNIVTRTAFIFACVILPLLAAGCDNSSPDSGPFKSSDMEQAASRTSPVIGKQAPDFTLPDQNSKPVALTGLKGKWVVLYFYPKDDTPGCTCQATEFTSLLQQFTDMGAVVLGVSPDSPDSHGFFIDKYNLDLTLLSDPDRKVMQQYGAWISSTLGTEAYYRIIRCTYLIGPDGVIRHHWPEVIPRGHAERVRQELIKAKAAG